MKPKNRIYCRVSQRSKMLFESKEKAYRFIEFNKDNFESDKIPIRAYYCVFCGGYHLTSRPMSNKHVSIIEGVHCYRCGNALTLRDGNSPMLKAELWKEIIEKANLKEAETKAHRRRKLFTRLNKVPDKKCFLILCYHCMEKILGRKLTLADLAMVDGHHVPFNEFFIQKHFLESKQ